MFRKGKEKADARYADYLMEADEDFPYEVYEKMTKEPDFEETLDYFVSSFEPSVRGLYARGGTDEQICQALIPTLHESIPGLDPRIAPYLAANIIAKIKFADPEKPLGGV